MRLLLSTLVFLSLAVSAQDEDCNRPWPVLVPREMPDREVMVELQRKVKAYLDAADIYLACNEAAQAAIKVDPQDADSIRQGEHKRDALARRFNNTVDEMHVVGEQYNQLVRAFKATDETASDDTEAANSDDDDGSR